MANLKNFAVGVILTPPTGTSGTSMVLQSGHGARMPTTFPYYLSCYPTGVFPTFSNTEVVRVDARSTDTLTIVRGQRTSTALTMSTGWIVDNAIMTEDLFTSSRNAPELLTGTPNGVLTTFTTSQPYTSIDLYKNGVYMQPGAGNDYTYSGSTVTFATAPATGAKLVAVGIVGSQIMISGSDSAFAGVTAVGTPNGALTTFTVPSGSYIGGTLEVYKNGVSQQRGTHFIETSPTAGTFTFTTAPIANSVITSSGQIAATVSGNADTTDNYHASQTMTANTIPVLDSNATLPQSAIQSSRIGYSQITSNFTLASTTNNVYTDATGLSISVVVPAGGRDIEISFKGTVRSSAGSGQGVGVAIVEGSTVIDSLNWDLATSGFGVNASFSTRVVAPSVGAHTYKMQVGHTSTAALSILAGSTPTTPSAYGVSYIMAKVI